MTTTATPGRDGLLELAEWCRIEREKLGAIDGYDYRSGEEFGLRRAQNEIESRLAAKPSDEGVYLVWSNQHRAWWRPDSHGYTDNVKSAGRYSRAEAISISFQGRDGWGTPKGVPDELAIAERDVPVFTESLSTTGEPKR